MSDAIESQGTVIKIGQGDATSVAYASEVFDAIGECKTWQGPDGSATVIDSSHLGSTRVEKRMGLPNEGQFQVTLNRIFDDVGQTSARAARAARQLRWIEITYSDTTVEYFTAYVMSFSTSGGVDQIVEGSLTLEISGEVTEA